MKLIYLSFSWIFGIFLSLLLPFPYSFLPAPAFFIPVIFSRHRKTWLLFSLCLLLFIGGVFRSRPVFSSQDQSRLQSYTGKGKIELVGVIDSDPEPKERFTTIQLKTEKIRAEEKWQEVSGACLLYAPKFPHKAQTLSRREFPYYHYGDKLWIKGKLSEPPKIEEFDYKEYLARKGIYSICYPERLQLLSEGKGIEPLAWIYQLKGKLSQVLKTTVPEPPSSLAQAVLLGKRSTLPTEVEENFIRSGIAHVLAISGLHIGIVAGIALSLGIWVFGRHRPFYLLLALFLIWLYTLLTGCRPPALRASIMGSLWVLGDWLGRPKSSFNALLLAAAIMIGVNPQILGGASFQLSFAAMAGLIFLSPIFISWGHKVLGGPEKVRASSRFAVESLSFTLGAVLGILPLLAFHFHRISLVVLPASFFALPAVPGVIITSALTGFLGLLSQGLAQFFGWLSWLFCTYVIEVGEAFSALPFASASVKAGIPFVIGYYSVFALAVFLPHNWKRIQGRLPDLLPRLRKLPQFVSWVPLKYILPSLLIPAILVWSAVFALPDGKLHLSFLDVGQGDSIFIQTPNGRQILIDGGPDSKVLLPELGERVPFWDHSLDLVVLTHPGEDHLTGLLGILRRYRVGKVLESGFESDSSTYQEWQRLIEEKDIERIIAYRGQRIKLGEGLKMKVLHPPKSLLRGTASDSNNNSVVIWLAYGKTSFLLTGDLMEEGEEVLLRKEPNLQATVLKVAHHGSSNSTSEEFLRTIDPQAAVISVGQDNPFSLPSSKVVDRLKEKVGKNPFLTSQDGTIEFITDGQRLWVKKNP